MIEELYKAAEQEAPNEMCGLIIEQNGIEKFIKCKNLEDDKKNGFKIDPKLLIRYQLNSKIKYVVHSHYDSDVRPSKHDIDNCKAVGIPYMIVSYPQKEVNIIQP